MGKKKNNKQFGFIYKIHCIPEDKYYIGQTRRSVQKRWKEHCDGKKKSTKAGDPVCLIDRLIHDLGKDNFELEIIEKPLIDDLNDREIYWIAKCGTLFPDGYNMNSGGGVSGRIVLSDVEKEEIVKAYLNGESCEKISNKYNCGSQYILDLLRQLNVKIRTHQECVKQQQKNIYYRLDSQSLEVLEEYKSFAQIGKWAQENNLTDNANASTAGLATRYAMLFGTEVYGYKWDSSWTEKEKEEFRIKFKQSSKTNKKKKSVRTDIRVPTRKELKKDLKALARKDIMTKYNISSGCLDNWKFFYCLDCNGNNTEGWENAPQQYIRKAKEMPTYNELLDSLVETFETAAKSFGVSIQTYKKWLKENNLPYKIKDVIDFLDKQSNKQKNKTNKKLSTKRKENHTKKQRQHIEKTTKRPPFETMVSLLCDNSFTKIGKIYGVSCNSVRKWCKYYNLPTHASVIKQIPCDNRKNVLENWDKYKNKYKNTPATNAPLNDREIEIIVKEFNSGSTINEISKKINRNSDTISKKLRQLGFVTNPILRSKKMNRVELNHTENSQK